MSPRRSFGAAALAQECAPRAATIMAQPRSASAQKTAEATLAPTLREAGRQAIRAPTAECARDARPEDLRCRRKRACAIQSRHQENEFQSRTRTTLPCAGNIADLTPIFRRAWKWSCSSSWTPGHSTSTGPTPPGLHGGLEDLFDTSLARSLAPTPRASTPCDPARLPNRTQGNLSTTSRSSAPEAAGIRRLSSSWCSSTDEPGGLPSLCGQQARPRAQTNVVCRCWSDFDGHGYVTRPWE